MKQLHIVIIIIIMIFLVNLNCILIILSYFIGRIMVKEITQSLSCHKVIMSGKCFKNQF